MSHSLVVVTRNGQVSLLRDLSEEEAEKLRRRLLNLPEPGAPSLEVTGYDAITQAVMVVNRATGEHSTLVHPQPQPWDIMLAYILD